MKKKILLIGVFILLICGCTNVKDLSYDDIIDTISIKEKKPNTFKKGYQYFLPKGIDLETSGTNYSILSSVDATYYLYVDLVSYLNKSDFEYKNNSDTVYSKKINRNDKIGYVEIKLWENNKYLIEIMYNYAKIEVMVEENLINKALINSICILNSIKYNDIVIERLLNDDELSYTEETFELFDEEKNSENNLEYKEETNIDEEQQDEIKDTDFIN